MRDRTQSGFGLLEAVVALTIVIIGALALQSMLSLSFRGSGHADLRLALRSLSESVREHVDCAKTLAQITNPTLQCNTVSPVALVLKDSSGQPITTPPRSVVGAFKPIDETLMGAGSFGKWELRTYCQPPGTTLYVRYAKAIESNKFARDPMTKRALDWQNSDTNPLFGTVDRALCGNASAKQSSPIQRFAIIYATFTNAAHGGQKIIVDLKRAVPLTISAVSGSLDGAQISEPFTATGPMKTAVMLKETDIRVNYYNISASPSIYANAALGLVTIGLSGGTSDIDYTGGYARVTVLVFQSDS